MFGDPMSAYDDMHRSALQEALSRMAGYAKEYGPDILRTIVGGPASAAAVSGMQSFGVPSGGVQAPSDGYAPMPLSRPAPMNQIAQSPEELQAQLMGQYPLGMRAYGSVNGNPAPLGGWDTIEGTPALRPQRMLGQTPFGRLEKMTKDTRKDQERSDRRRKMGLDSLINSIEFHGADPATKVAMLQAYSGGGEAAAAPAPSDFALGSDDPTYAAAAKKAADKETKVPDAVATLNYLHNTLGLSGEELLSAYAKAMGKGSSGSLPADAGMIQFIMDKNGIGYDEAVQQLMEIKKAGQRPQDVILNGYLADRKAILGSTGNTSQSLADLDTFYKDRFGWTPEGYRQSQAGGIDKALEAATQQPVEAQSFGSAPAGAVEALRANPGLADKFDQISQRRSWGVTSQQILSATK